MLVFTYDTSGKQRGSRYLDYFTIIPSTRKVTSYPISRSDINISLTTCHHLNIQVSRLKASKAKSRVTMILTISYDKLKMKKNLQNNKDSFKIK